MNDVIAFDSYLGALTYLEATVAASGKSAAHLAVQAVDGRAPALTADELESLWVAACDSMHEGDFGDSVRYVDALHYQAQERGNVHPDRLPSPACTRLADFFSDAQLQGLTDRVTDLEPIQTAR